MNDFLDVPEVNFTRKQIEDSNEAILASGRSYSARLVFPLDSISIVQLIQDQNYLKRRERRRADSPVSAPESSDGGYEIDLSKPFKQLIQIDL
jgi:hypothetical protein